MQFFLILLSTWLSATRLDAARLHFKQQVKGSPNATDRLSGPDLCKDQRCEKEVFWAKVCAKDRGSRCSLDDCRSKCEAHATPFECTHYSFEGADGDCYLYGSCNLHAKTGWDTYALSGSCDGNAVAPLTGKDVAQAFLLGMEAISDGVQPLLKEPADLVTSFGKFQIGLWKVVEKVVKEGRVEEELMARIKRAWDKSFTAMPDVTADVIDFHKTGKTESLTSAVHAIVQTALRSTAIVAPGVAKFFNAVADLLQGCAGAWAMHAEGKTAEAVQSIWKSVHTACDDVLPEQVTTHETYELVMGTIDGVMSELNRHVLEFKRRILNSKVCYKRSMHRERSRPNQCRDGFTWDGGAFCFPDKDHGANCWNSCGGAGLCPSFCGGLKACCKSGDPSDPPECKGATGFKDYSFTKGNSRTYHQCANPGPALAFKIDTCGELDLVGIWVKSGSHSGKAVYKLASNTKATMEWSHKRALWRIYIDNAVGHWRDTLYVNSKDTPEFPADGWEAIAGVAPAPRLDSSDFVFASLPAAAAPGPDGPSLVQQSSESEALPWFGREDIPQQDYGMHEAMCDMDTEYNEKNGNWCLTKCPNGYYEKNGQTCGQLCLGKWPADGPAVCGQSPGELHMALAEMFGIVVKESVRAAVLIDDMKEDGVDAEKLSGTINAFIDMSKPFARPMCSENMVPEEGQ